MSLLAAVAVAGCGGVTDSGEVGEVRLSVSGSLASDGLAGVLAQVACEDGTLLERYAPFESEGLPSHVDPTFAGSTFADVFAVLPAGLCDVTVWAMVDEATPAEGCEAASVVLDVVAGQTMEAVLPIVCKSAGGGGADVAIVIDHAPVVDQLVVSPGTVVPVCTTVALRVDATDADFDALTYAFDVKPKADGAVFDASSDGDLLLLTATTPGGYVITATVSDGLVETTAVTSILFEDGSCP